MVMSSTSSSFTFPGGGGEGGSVGRVGRWIGGWDTVLVLATSPHPYVQSKSHLINKIPVPLCARYLSVPGMGSKTKYILLIINHNITK